MGIQILKKEKEENSVLCAASDNKEVEVALGCYKYHNTFPSGEL
jgi:hypothetical protein